MMNSKDRLQLLFQTVRDLRELEARMKETSSDDPQFDSMEVLFYYLQAGLEKLQNDSEVMALYKRSDAGNLATATD